MKLAEYLRHKQLEEKMACKKHELEAVSTEGECPRCVEEWRAQQPSWKEAADAAFCAAAVVVGPLLVWIVVFSY